MESATASVAPWLLFFRLLTTALQRAIRATEFRDHLDNALLIDVSGTALKLGIRAVSGVPYFGPELSMASPDSQIPEINTPSPGFAERRLFHWFFAVADVSHLEINSSTIHASERNSKAMRHTKCIDQ